MLKPLCASLLIFSAASVASAQAVQPPGLQEEASGPFSWFLVPSDEIGFKDSPQGFQITYDGALNNGYGELDFSAGSPATPINQRVKTLYRNSLPIVEYGFVRDGARYDFEVFGAPPRLDPREDLMAFVRIRISNPGPSAVHASLRAAYGERGKTARDSLNCHRWYQDKFMDAATFKSNADSKLDRGAAIKNGHVVYFYSGAPSLDPDRLAVQYDYDLQPGQSETVLVKTPFVPISNSKPAIVKEAQSMSDGAYFDKVVKFWNDINSRALQVDVPDPKVVDTMRTSLAYDLMARDIEADGKHFTQTVNKFQYHAFFMRDTSFIARSYELLNLPDVARTTIEKYLVRDASGKVVNFLHNMPDDWGQSLWAVGSYLRSTDDASFAKEILPAIAPHLDDFVKSTRSDPLGLWPVAGPYDNELINGHYTSHDLWALLGLKEAENICRVAGDTAEARRASDLYTAFDKVFMDRLAILTAKDEGYIPPGMDDPNAGYDWENASGGVYPFHVLPPDHPWVTATLNMERAYKYREGIMTWGPNAWVGKQAADAGKPFDPLYLHDYDTFQVTEALLARGEQQKVIEDLYSTLVHTSSTNAGFETGIKPWGDRDPTDNYPPHGWFAARYNELVRNMLLREDGEDLHLASALAPDWVKPGLTTRVKNGATDFGQLDYTISWRAHLAVVNLKPNWRHAPARVLFHVPWFIDATSAATGSGAALAIRNGMVEIPQGQTLVLKIASYSHPDLSYKSAVDIWLKKAYGLLPKD